MRHGTVLGAVSIALLATLAAPSHAQLFLDREVAADRLDAGGLGVARSRPVAVDFGALPAADGVGALPSVGHLLHLNLFEDASLPAHMARAKRLESGLAWSGRLVGDPMSAVDIVVVDGVVTGSVNGEAGSYRIRWDGIGQIVEEMDYDQFDESNCVLNEFDLAPEEADEPQAPLDTGDTIDVLVVYTPAARSAVGGTSAMLSLINLAVSETNTAYANSSVVQRLRLVHTAEVSYTEASFSTDLCRLTCPKNQTCNPYNCSVDTVGYMDNVQALRDTYKADMVSLIVDGSGYCGIAWLWGGASNAYSVVDYSCATGYYSFGHELGHNQGLNHAHADPTGTGAYTYSYGHKWVDTVPEEDLYYRSVMAYSPGTRVPYYSNPSVSHAGQPTGISDYADNSRSLNNTQSTVAGWRAGAAQVSVTSPDGGESWLVGSTQTITWTSSQLDPASSIELTYTEGTTTYQIASGIDRTATTYGWTVPDTPGSGFRVTVCSQVSGACEATDSSDGTFSISTPVPVSLSVTRTGIGVGTVTSSPAGIDCGADCAESYVSGTVVTLTAVEGPSSVLVGWSGDCTGVGLTCDVTMDAAKAVTVEFDLVAEGIGWERLIGTETVGSLLRRPSGAGWNAGAVSNRVLVGGAGYVEYTVPVSPGYVMFGLSHGDTDGSYSDIDYALYGYPPSGQLMVFEGGSSRGVVGSFAAGDVLRVSVEGGVVTYRRNGALLGTSVETPTYPLLADTSLYSTGAELLDGRIAGQLEDRVVIPDTEVVWRNHVRTRSEGSTLVRESTTGWNGGASSAQELVSGDGYTEYRVTDVGDYAMFGLSHGDTDASYGDIDYAIYTYPPTSRLMVYEGGVYEANLGSYGMDDVLRVSVESGVVTYSVNGVLLYSSSASPVYPLVTDVSVYSAGSRLEGSRMGGDLREIVGWTHLSGLDWTGDTLSRPVPGGWTAGAISGRRIPSGSGGAEYPVADLSSYVMFGLSHGDTDGSYADIDYAIYTYPPTGQLMVYEGGSSRGTVGTYVAGDVLGASVEDGTVTYWKNGVLVYTSGVTATYPLVLDVSLKEGQITGARLFGNLSSPPVIEEDVVWTNLVNVTDSGGVLERPVGTGWDAGAVSTQEIPGEGYVEYTVSSLSDYVMFGLGNGDTDQGHGDIEYALYTYAGTGRLLIFEGGAYAASAGTYTVGDVLRVSVEGGVVKYRQNGVLVYSSSTAPVFPLNVDTSLYSTGAAISGARIGWEE